MSRKVIQIATMPESRASGDVSVTAVLYALCDDGTMWAISYDEWNDWREVKPIPQPQPAEAGESMSRTAGRSTVAARCVATSSHPEE